MIIPVVTSRLSAAARQYQFISAWFKTCCPALTDRPEGAIVQTSLEFLAYVGDWHQRSLRYSIDAACVLKTSFQHVQGYATQRVDAPYIYATQKRNGIAT